MEAQPCTNHGGVQAPKDAQQYARTCQYNNRLRAERHAYEHHDVPVITTMYPRQLNGEESQTLTK
eukprot:2353676-Pyramimonas_sp.AAC.1